MAVSGRKSFLRSSSCELCSCKEVTEEVVGYCTECHKDLCVDCMKSHMSPLFHDLDEYSINIIKSCMNGWNYAAFEPDLDDFCEKHKLKVKHYCKMHDDFGCLQCMESDHIYCPRINNVRKVLHKNKNVKDVNSLYEKIGSMENKMKSFHDKLLSEIKVVEWTYKNVLDEIIAYRDKIYEHVDELFSNTVKEAQKIKKEHSGVLNDLIEENEALMNDMVNVRVRLNYISSPYSMVYFTEQVKQRLEYAEMKMKALNEMKDCLSQNYRYVELSDIENFLSKYENLGSFVSGVSVNTAKALMSCIPKQSNHKQPEKSAAHVCEVPDENGRLLFSDIEYENDFGSNDYEIIDRNLKYIRKINLRIENDKRVCGINDCLMLGSGKLVVTDGFNHCVKLVDLSKPSVQSTPYLVHSPDCVTAINDRLVATTLPKNHSIHFFHVHEKLIDSHELKVDGECRGIAYKNDKLAVTFKDPNRVKIMTIDGTVLHTITSPKISDDMNILPSAIIFGMENDTVIMSDINYHVIIKMNFNGKICGMYYSDTLCLPLGLTLTDDGTLLVCCRNSQSVESISDDFKTGKVLLKNESSITHPICVAFCNITNQLYICNFSSKFDEVTNNSVHEFQLL